jgi:MFS transporter, DHA1 family, multidrug resistance protein
MDVVPGLAHRTHPGASFTAPTGRRALLLFLVLGGVAAYGPASMDMYIPALPQVAHSFRVATSATELTVTAYLIGLGVGQLLAGPFSDVLGRRRPLLVGLAVYTVASLSCALAPTLSLLVAMRLLQGLAAASGVAISRAIIRDLYSGAQAARYFSRLMLIIGAAPVVAPVVGAQLLRVTSWRGIFVALSLLSIMLLASTAAFLPETLAEERRGAASVIDTGRTFAMLFRDRVFLGYALALGCATASLIGYISGSPFVIEDVYGHSPQFFSLIFSVNALAMIAFSQLNAHLVQHVPSGRLLAWGLSVNVATGAVLVMIVSIGGLGLTPILICFFVLFSTWGLIPPNITALALTDHPQAAGTASAALGLFQYGIGAIAAPLVGAAGSRTAMPLALTIIGFGAASLAAIGSTTWRRMHATRSHDASALLNVAASPAANQGIRVGTETGINAQNGVLKRQDPDSRSGRVG